MVGNVQMDMRILVQNHVIKVVQDKEQTKVVVVEETIVKKEELKKVGLETLMVVVDLEVDVEMVVAEVQMDSALFNIILNFQEKEKQTL
jgi:ketopantoate hydroxymethyltransferase